MFRGIHNSYQTTIVHNPCHHLSTLDYSDGSDLNFRSTVTPRLSRSGKMKLIASTNTQCSVLPFTGFGDHNTRSHMLQCLLTHCTQIHTTTGTKVGFGNRACQVSAHDVYHVWYCSLKFTNKEKIQTVI